MAAAIHSRTARAVRPTVVYRVLLLDAMSFEPQSPPAEFGNKAAVRAFLSRWYDDNRRQPSGMFPLVVAMEEGERS